MTTTSIQFSLDRGERQLWASVPRQGLLLRPSDVRDIPLSVCVAVFAYFWEGGVIHVGNWLFAFYGIPLVGAAIYLLIGRFWGDAWQRARTTYAVTNERIIIEHGLFKPTSTSIDLRTLSEVTVRERKDGAGTITFRTIPPLVPTTRPFSPRFPVFEMISDVWRVCAVIRDAQRGAPPALRRYQEEGARA